MPATFGGSGEQMGPGSPGGTGGPGSLGGAGDSWQGSGPRPGGWDNRTNVYPDEGWFETIIRNLLGPEPLSSANGLGSFSGGLFRGGGDRAGGGRPGRGQNADRIKVFQSGRR